MARPVLLLHPLGSDHRFWDGVDLAPGRRWLALDLPGHGQQPAPVVGDGVAGLAARVLELADEAEVEDFDVVGVSLGGLLAQHLAVHRADRVGHVVLVDTVARYPEAMGRMWVERARTARIEGMSPLVAPTLDIWFGEEFREARPDLVERTRDTLLRTDPEGYARTCEILAAADLSDVTSRLPALTSSVCGEDDGAPFRAAAEEFAAATGGHVQWLAGKHAAVLESPERFAQHLEQFLSAGPGRHPTERTPS